MKKKSTGQHNSSPTHCARLDDMTDPSATPKELKARADEVSVAFLMLLERLPPDARAAFLLHELFGANYREVAAAIGKSKTTCRQLVNQAKAQLRDERPRRVVAPEFPLNLLHAFARATEHGDPHAMSTLIDEDAILVADSRGKLTGVSAPMIGGQRIARLYQAVCRRYRGKLGMKVVTLNGQWVVLRFIGGSLESMQSIETDGERIVRILVQRHPDTISRIAAMLERR
jgi:RNA polymerase sigma-70 factor (ECF subfamily)